MTSILAVASYLPPRSVAVADHLAELGIEVDAGLYQQYYGFGRIRRDPPGNLAEQLVAAGRRLDRLATDAPRVRYLVHAPTIQHTAPYPHTPLWQARAELGLHQALPFTLSQHACASALLAIDTCGRLLAADGDPDALALLLTGEKTFTGVAQFIVDSAVLGEGVAAVLIGPGGDRDRVLSYATRTLGEFHEAPELSPRLQEEFQGRYTEVLAEVILAATRQAGLSIADITLVLPHNVNRISWWRVLTRAGLPKSRLFLDNQAELGHCFGADPFLGYQAALASGRLRPGDHYVLTAAGLGATLAATVVRH
ncbi:3-oxoacyl-ACP synthase [Micromonospora fiedleri]|uniref:3-oxoacyl-ACP synthase n=1 Tax=Micromonospora fiedleri TaxID=1157498 RepID=A0ABS1UPR5_9ACTN|nr:3-oxoacyl-[acyl-carrier-protein] synthase III C-terminal domain-containing protein [Micromonospora fiedleri]MBL6278341.1 3-oxoacyl-ACP synthase [Micromonospora fiedleri]